MSRRTGSRLAALLAAVVALLLAGASAASAHPLGNFSVNSATTLRVQPDAVEVDLVLDLAEIPTLQAFPDATAGGAPAGAEAWRAAQCPALAGQLALRADGQPLALAVTSSDVAFPEGSAGLATTRLACSLRASGLDTPGSTLTLASTVAEGRVGWHEVTAVGDGVSLRSSDVPATSASAQLTAYPQDLLQSPPDVRDATIEVGPVGGAVAGSPGARDNAAEASTDALRGAGRITSAYTDLVSTLDLSWGVAVLAVLASVVLGGLHAFAPGHGKTLMAAYLVGKNGSLRQAGLIGLSVTATHTLGVLVLGVVLSTAVVAAPEHIYPWLSLTSGLLLVGIGAVLLRQGLARRRVLPVDVAEPVLVGAAAPHPHPHGDHAHGADHHPHPHRDHALGVAHEHLAHEHHAHDHGAPALTHSHGGAAHTHGPLPTSWRSLVGVGFVGGLVPSPSALIVLLGGIALGRTWFGVLLVVAYGAGMAAALVTAGLLLVRARDSVVRRLAARRPDAALAHRARLVAAALPAVTATAVVLVGLGVAVEAVRALSGS